MNKNTMNCDYDTNPSLQRLKYFNQFPQNESTSTTLSSINNTKIEDTSKVNKTFCKKSSFDDSQKHFFNNPKGIYKKSIVSAKKSVSSITPIKKAYTQEIDFDPQTITYGNNGFATNPLKKKLTFDTDSLDFTPFEFNDANTPKTASAVMNLEELLILEEKLTSIIKCISNSLQCYDECFEWWNYYFNSSLCNAFPTYFLSQEAKEIVSLSTNLELLTMILCYDLSFIQSSFMTLCPYLKEILSFHHSNLILLSKYFLSKIISPHDNIWIKKMEKLIQENNACVQCNAGSLIYQIKTNNQSISNIQRVIIKNYDNNRVILEDLTFLYKNIATLSIEDINNFYRDKVIRVFNQNGSILASSTDQKQKDFLIQNVIQIPYLNKESLKKYTLVLDLDETLIHFKVDSDSTDEGTGILHFRPGLFEFLEQVSNYYEIVVFTAATKDYANPIIDAIEQNKIYFDYRLYREHTVIIGNDFVKDISKLGRDLSKIIIVDNMPQSFRLQKDNGVFIRAYWGKEEDDCALVDLMPILINIAKEGWDVRQGLRFYKDEIINKVTSNFYRKQLC